MPKSSVSRAIVRLEARLGVRLLERTTRSVTLTEAGGLYLDHCRKVMEDAEQADLAVGALLAKPRGRLCVATTVMFARFVLAPLMGEFLERCPELRLILQTIVPDGAPRDGGVDVTIRSGPVEDSRMLMKPVMRVTLGAYASPAYLRKTEKSCPLRSPADLQAHSCITTNCGLHGEPTENAVWRMRRGAELRAVRVEPRAAVSDVSINHQLALSGVGIALLGQRIARTDVAAGRLVRVLQDWQPDPVELYALYPSRLSTSPKVRALLEFLSEKFRGEDAIA